MHAYMDADCCSLLKTGRKTIIDALPFKNQACVSTLHMYISYIIKKTLQKCIYVRRDSSLSNTYPFKFNP